MCRYGPRCSLGPLPGWDQYPDGPTQDARSLVPALPTLPGPRHQPQMFSYVQPGTIFRCDLIFVLCDLVS